MKTFILSVLMLVISGTIYAQSASSQPVQIWQIGGRTTQTDSIVVTNASTTTVWSDDRTVLFGQITNPTADTIYIGFKNPMNKSAGAAILPNGSFMWGLRTPVGCPSGIYAVTSSGTATLSRIVIKP